MVTTTCSSHQPLNPPITPLTHIHPQSRDILKIDIEGSEYTALDTFMDDFADDPLGTLPIGQVMIELHLSDDKNVGFNRFYKWWERLESFGMRPTWLEVNLLAVTLGGGKTDPRCVEYVWVNAKDPRNILMEE